MKYILLIILMILVIKQLIKEIKDLKRVLKGDIQEEDYEDFIL